MKYITVSPTLEKAVREKIEATLEICRKRYGKALPFPTLHFRQSGRVAGYYQPPSAFHGKPESLNINPDYFKKYYDEQLNVTVPHEVAHYVVHHVFGNVQTHGREWASVMRVIGLPPDRCHTFSVEGVKTRQVAKPFHYGCGCVTHHFTKLKHSRAQSNVTIYGKTGYSCRKCGKRLVYEGFMNGSTFIPAKKTTNEPTKEIAVVSFKLPSIPRPAERPITVTASENRFRTVTKFMNGMLTNVQVPA